jgi:hypothetical protein
MFIEVKLKLKNINKVLIDFKVMYEILTKDYSRLKVNIMNFNKLQDSTSIYGILFIFLKIFKYKLIYSNFKESRDNLNKFWKNSTYFMELFPKKMTFSS